MIKIAKNYIAEFLNVDRYIFCGTMEEKWAELYTNLNYKNETKFNRHVVYALAKITARQALKLRYINNGPDILFATNSHVMGPGDTRDSFLQVSLKKILNKEDINMSSGEPIFDVINVKGFDDIYNTELSDYDKEHVIPIFYKKFQYNIFKPKNIDKLLAISIDEYSDYEKFKT